MTLTATTPVTLGNFSAIADINNQDEIVGTSISSSLPATWQNGLVGSLSLYGSDSNGAANAINDEGQIVGASNSLSANRPVMWANGRVEQIETTSGSARLYGINDSGTMVGSARDSAKYDNAYVVRNDIATDLGALPGGDASAGSAVNSRALAVNDSEQIVGFSQTSFGVIHATLWQNSTITDLGGVSNSEPSEALGINKSGLTVGFAANSSGTDEAVTWQNGTMTVLPVLQSGGHSIAYAVNDAGIVAGRSDIYLKGAWQDHAVIWQNGQLIDLNSLLPANSDWVLNYATTINNNGQIAGMGTFGGFTTFGFTLSIGDSTGPTVSAASALQAFAAAPHAAAWRVSDSAANILADLTALGDMAQVAKLLQVTFTDSSTPVLTVTDLQWGGDSGVFGVMAGGYNVHVTGIAVGIAATRLYQSHVTEVGITDTAVAVGNNFSLLAGWAANSQLLSVNFTDADPTITILGQNYTADKAVLPLIQGTYQLDVVGVSASQALLLSANSHLSALTIDDGAGNIVAASQSLQPLKVSLSYVISDTGANISANLDALEALHAAGDSVQLSVTGTGTPTLSLTAAQLTNDFPILHNANGSFQLSINAGQPNLSITGLSGHGNVAVFQDDAADYTVASSGGFITVTDTGTGRSSVDSLLTITALQFKDGTEFVASAPSASGVTTGNVTELYAAVLSREPDVSGLQFYQQYLASNANTPALTLAEWFLSSTEYMSNSAHTYAESAQGDAQFITDTYQNLLHRAPDTGAVTFYQAVVAKFTAGLTSGTPAYATAQLAGHAQVLVYFASSPEFLGDVQITAQHPADAQHWLYVI